MSEIDKLGWVCIQNGKLLCARSRGKQLFYIPGGKREFGEDDQTALVREIREELSVDLVAESLQLIGSFVAPADGKVDTLVKLTCYTGDYRGHLLAASEIEELRWLSYSERQRSSVATILIFDWLKSQGQVAT